MIEWRNPSIVSTDDCLSILSLVYLNVLVTDLHCVTVGLVKVAHLVGGVYM
jgi:hypothetical protein